MKETRGRLILVAALSLIPLLHFPRALVGDRTLFARDITMVWAPQIEGVVRQVARGDAPFFDSRRAFGQPLFADPRSEILYPPAWIHWVLPMETSYPIFAAFHIILAALGAARLARRLFPNASLPAQAVAGLSYGASGPILSLVSHWHHLAAAALMPWIIERADLNRGERTPWFALSGLMALQVFAGSPDYTFATLLLCLLRWVTRGDFGWREGFRASLGLTLGLLISSVQLLPSLAFAADADRVPLPIGWSLSPLHPALSVETALPIRVDGWPLRPEAREFLFGSPPVWMFSHYLGLSVWVLAILGFGTSEQRARRFALSGVILGLGLAGGITSEWLQRLVAHVPMISGLRFPTKHLAIASLALSMCAASGAMAPVQWVARDRRRAVVFSLLSIAFGFLLFGWSTQTPAADKWSLLIRPAVAGLCAIAILIGGSRSAAALVIPALVAIDLLFTHSAINPTTPSWFFRDRPPLTSTIPKGARIYVSDYSINLNAAPIRLPKGPPYHLARVPEGFAVADALPLAATWYLNPPTASRFGYYGSFDLDILDFYRAPLKKTIEGFVTSRDREFLLSSLQRASVEYVVTMDPPEFWSFLPLVAREERFFEAPVQVYRVPEPWPRARYETTTGALESGSPSVTEARDGLIRVEGTTAQTTHLVLATAYDGGWRAHVDGIATPISENAMAFLSVPLSAGFHRIELVYRPPGVGLGAGLSAAGLILAAVLGIRSRGRGQNLANGPAAS